MARRIPSYRLHKGSGQAIVTLNGRDIYLGVHNTPESRQRYDKLIAEWLASNRSVRPEVSSSLTVAEVVDAYWEYAKVYYSKDGKVTKQGDRVKRSLVPLAKLYSDTPVNEFGPLALKAVQAEMVREGLNRNSVNARIGCVKRCFKWASSEELVPVTVFESLRTVEGLKKGRTSAPEPEPVLPVPQSDIDAIQEYVLPVVWQMIQVQILTGSRPGEVCTMRAEEIDRSGDVWIYTPSDHKMSYKKRNKIIFIGPRAQKIITPLLFLGGYLFSPKRAVKEYLESKSQSTRRGRTRRPGEYYHTTSYTRAIAKACKRAKVPSWYPHRLRHNAATLLVEQFGWDVARTVLGHASLDATRIYAEDAQRKAKDAIRKIG